MLQVDFKIVPNEITTNSNFTQDKSNNLTSTESIKLSNRQPRTFKTGNKLKSVFENWTIFHRSNFPWQIPLQQTIKYIDTKRSGKKGMQVNRKKLYIFLYAVNLLPTIATIMNLQEKKFPFHLFSPLPLWDEQNIPFYSRWMNRTEQEVRQKQTQKLESIWKRDENRMCAAWFAGY